MNSHVKGMGYYFDMLKTGTVFVEYFIAFVIVGRCFILESTFIIFP